MVVPLPDLSPQVVSQRVAGVLTALEPLSRGQSQTAAEAALNEVLGWLWDHVANPILGRLGILGPPTEGVSWPRLWWCVSGLLSFLPLHAAGYHETRFHAAPATVIDRVVSSYTPTIRALAHARRPLSSKMEYGNGNLGLRFAGQVLAVAMPHTPGASDLPGAQEEADSLQRRFPGRVTVLSGPDATHDSVLALLPAASWVHLACHGQTNLTDPSASSLLVHDHQTRPLTVADITRLHLKDADLAFLSACSTAQPGVRLADEAIQLASAFQLAGYRHVIGTLWPVGDRASVAIADDIYTAITSTGDPVGAVHAATRKLRNHWSRQPSAWASHLHVGA